MKNKRVYIRLFTCVTLCALVAAQPVNAYAMGKSWKRGRCHRKSVIARPPFFFTPVVGGLAYLYCKTLAGRNKTTYVVVPAKTETTVISCVPGTATSTAAVHIPNSNGSYTKIVLKKTGDGYTGPQGEYYPEHPTVEQLRVLYGK